MFPTKFVELERVSELQFMTAMMRTNAFIRQFWRIKMRQVIFKMKQIKKTKKKPLREVEANQIPILPVPPRKKNTCSECRKDNHGGDLTKGVNKQTCPMRKATKILIKTVWSRLDNKKSMARTAYKYEELWNDSKPIEVYTPHEETFLRSILGKLTPEEEADLNVWWPQEGEALPKLMLNLLELLNDGSISVLD